MFAIFEQNDSSCEIAHLIRIFYFNRYYKHTQTKAIIKFHILPFFLLSPNVCYCCCFGIFFSLLLFGNHALLPCNYFDLNKHLKSIAAYKTDRFSWREQNIILGDLMPINNSRNAIDPRQLKLMTCTNVAQRKHCAVNISYN